MHVLLVDHDDDYEVAEVHGPFNSVEEAQLYAEKFRDLQGLPVRATSENNDEWTEAGWYFGIFEPTRIDFNAAYGWRRKKMPGSEVAS